MTGTELQRKRVAYARALETALDKIVSQLSQIPEVEKVILFGSYAAGRRDLFTDLDLLVVMDSDKSFVQRTAELYGQVQVDVDLDLLVYTPEELEKNQDTGFIRGALRTGRVVYEKTRS